MKSLIYRKDELLIKEYDISGFSIDSNCVQDRIWKINSIVGLTNPTRPHIVKNGCIFICKSLIKKRIIPPRFLIPNLLISLAEKLDLLHFYNLVHGDIKYTNLLFSSGKFEMIDWEPVLVYSKCSKTFFRSTMPYIATSDIALKKITKYTDRISFYFLCRRLLGSSVIPRKEDIFLIEKSIINLNCKEICEFQIKNFTSDF
jgi:serine/threonine protein kinase